MKPAVLNRSVLKTRPRTMTLTHALTLILMLTLTLALLGLAGCAVDQQKEVATYRKVLDGQTRRKAVVYQEGQPLSLHQALQLANANSEELAIDGEHYLQALIDKDRAAANFLPTVSFAPAFTRQEATHIGGPTGVAANFVPKQSLDLPLHAGMDVSPVADAANIARANSNAKAQHATLLDLKAQVLMDVAATYYQILRTTSQVRVLENSVIVQQKRLVDMQAKKQAGTALPLDVAQIRAQLARTKSKLIHANNDLHNGRSTLAYLIGVPVVDGTLTDELNPPATTPQTPMLVTVARLNRQDVKAADAQIQAAADTLQRAWGRYFPSISLDFDYYLKRESFPEDVNWFGMIKLQLPLFSAGLIHADVRTSWSQLRQARLRWAMLNRQVQKEVRIASSNLASSHDQLQQLQEQVDAAQEALDRSEQSYAAGLATSLDRLVAQDNLLSAQLDLASEQLDHKLDYLKLLRVVGRLKEDIATTWSPLKTPATADASATPLPVWPVKNVSAHSRNDHPHTAGHSL